MQISENSNRRVIGSKWTLLGVRIIQLGSIVFAGLVCASLDMGPMVRLSVFVALSAMCVVVGHPLARIEGDDSGLFIQRYLRVHFVEWPSVTGVRTSFGDGGIRVEFRHMVAGLRYAMTNFPNMPVGEAVAAVAGRRKSEIVSWIEGHIRAATESSESRSLLGLQ